MDVLVTADAGGLVKYAELEARAYVARKCREIAARVGPAVAGLVAAAMRAAPEYESLASGRLRAEFGLGTAAGGPVEGKDAAESVVEAVRAAVQSYPLPAAGPSLGGVFVGAFREGFVDALSARWASYTAASRKGESRIEWLSWLLFAGDAVVVQGYEILTDYPTRKVSARSASRTGLAIMVRRDFSGAAGRYNRARGRSGPSSWRVPPEFAGTESDNWLSRAADAVGPEVAGLLEAEARAVVGGG